MIRALLASVLIHAALFLVFPVFFSLTVGQQVAGLPVKATVIAPPSALPTTAPSDQGAKALAASQSVLTTTNAVQRVFPTRQNEAVAVKAAQDSPQALAATFSAEALSEFKLALARHVRRLGRAGGLPIKVENPLEAVVQVTALPGSAVPIVSLARSSGSDGLDEWAVLRIREALAILPLPNGISGSGFALLLPVAFLPD